MEEASSGYPATRSCGCLAVVVSTHPHAAFRDFKSTRTTIVACWASREAARCCNVKYSRLESVIWCFEALCGLCRRSHHLETGRLLGWPVGRRLAVLKTLESFRDPLPSNSFQRCKRQGDSPMASRHRALFTYRGGDIWASGDFRCDGHLGGAASSRNRYLCIRLLAKLTVSNTEGRLISDIGIKGEGEHLPSETIETTVHTDCTGAASSTVGGMGIPGVTACVSSVSQTSGPLATGSNCLPG